LTQIIKSNNDEFDEQFGGGIPTPTLTLIEGDHGTGKSAICALLINGLLKANKKVLCITDNTVREYIDKMKSITYDFSKPFIENRLSILPLHVYGRTWSKNQSGFLLPALMECIQNSIDSCDCIVIDSLSLLTIYSDPGKILDFFTFCKHMVTNGMMIIVTIHPDDLPTHISRSVKGSSDVFLQLGFDSLGSKQINTVKIVKLLGAKSKPESNFAFEVDMIFGIKILPISMANI